MESSSELAKEIEAYCKREGIAPSTFGQRFFQNSRLYKRLCEGGSITLKTYAELKSILSSDAEKASA